MKKTTKAPWMPASDYGRGLPTHSINLLVRDVQLSIFFYEHIVGAKVIYSDQDFAAIKLKDTDFMLHADHTYENHPWITPLNSGTTRGLGVEIRVLGIDPDKIETQARKHSATLIQEARDKPHGWREVMVADPDGYIWAFGINI